MTRSEEKREAFVEAVVAHLVSEGLADTGLRSLARVCGTSDRMLIYHFGSKDALLEQAFGAVVAGLTAQLDALLGPRRRAPARLLEDLLAAVDRGPFLPVVRLWFELVGRAVTGEEPYRASARALGERWLAWIEAHLPRDRADRAPELFATLEGTLMLRLLDLPGPERPHA
jgi:AcrR family transcriptional regulator